MANYLYHSLKALSNGDDDEGDLIPGDLDNYTDTMSDFEDK